MANGGYFAIFRACLALAKRLGWTALTTEEKWRKIAAAEGITLHVLSDRQP